MRIGSVVLAIILALACGVVAIVSVQNRGPMVEAAILSILLLASAIAALAGGNLRYLSASYGILIGVLVAWGEFIFLVKGEVPGVNTILGVDAGGLAQLIGVLLIPIIGLILSLLA